MTFLRIIVPALVLLALAAGAAAPYARAEEDDTQWLDERREERLEEMRKERNARTRRDPLTPLYEPGASGSSGSRGLSRPSPQSPVAPPSGGAPSRPWNVR